MREVNAKLLSDKLSSWYELYKREMPWRGEKAPYRIWLSEVILQQTRVAQGGPYYMRFIEQYPTVHHLAQASEAEVLKTWEGLGYYSRARNLHKAAKEVSQRHEGVFPDSFQGLLGLPGIGEYTAAAIASICYDEPVAVVDGNVNRLISRLYGIDLPLHTAASKKAIRSRAQEIIEKSSVPAGEMNQAMMEFGAIQCIPRTPTCETCVLSHLCVARRTDRVESLPVKKKPNKVRKRYFAYTVYIDGDHTFVHQRQQKDIWQGLYEFTLVEGEEAYIGTDQDPGLIGVYETKHILSHQHIQARFIVKKGVPPEESTPWVRVAIAALDDYPFARLSTRFLENSPPLSAI